MAQFRDLTNVEKLAMLQKVDANLEQQLQTDLDQVIFTESMFNAFNLISSISDTD